MAEWTYSAGGVDDFEGAPDWAVMRTTIRGNSYFIEGHFIGAKVLNILKDHEFKLLDGFDTSFEEVIAIRKKSEAAMVASINKYGRQCKGVTIDVYDVLQAFNVTNPALQHLVKKALCAGLRGHKDRAQDLQDILDGAKRAIELEKE